MLIPRVPVLIVSSMALIWIPGARQQGLSTSAGTAPVPISAVSDSNETVWLQIEKPTQEITQTTRLDREHSEGLGKHSDWATSQIIGASMRCQATRMRGISQQKASAEWRKEPRNLT